MARNYGYVKAPTCTLEEARAIPTFLRVLRVNRPDYSCEDCREHGREPWVDGSACDLHTLEEVALPEGAGWNGHHAATLALEVLRAGGNPEPRFTSGLAAAQWNYKRPRKAADRDAMVHALTTTTTALAAA